MKDDEILYRINLLKWEEEYKYLKSKNLLKMSEVMENTQVREIREVKRTQLAMYKGLGWTNEEIANKMRITTGEVKQALQHFGMIKTRSTSTKAGYTIQFTDDVVKS